MAAFDLIDLAQRARAAGKSAVQFVQECFEDSTAVVRFPGASGGSVTVPTPNVSVANGPGRPQLAGGLPGLNNIPGGRPVTTGDAGTDAILFALVRAAILERDKDKALALQMLQNLKSPIGNISQKGQNATTQLVAGLVSGLTQAEALFLVMKALATVYGLNFRTAVFMVMSQAGKTFQWQLNNTALPNLQRIAVMVVCIVLAAAQAFSMTMDAVRREMEVMVPDIYAIRAESNSYANCAGLISTIAVIIIIIIVSIVMTTVGVATAGAGTAVTVAVITTAIMGASAASIAAAITAVFAAGATADEVVRAGFEIFRGRIVVFQEAVCRGWALAVRRRPPLVDLVRALHRVLGLTADQIANSLRKAGLDFGTIASALTDEFGRDAGMLARAFRAAGAGMHDAAVALKNAGFSALDTGRALKDEYSANRADQVQTELTNVGYRADEVANAIRDLFRSAADTARSIIGGFR